MLEYHGVRKNSRDVKEQANFKGISIATACACEEKAVFEFMC